MSPRILASRSALDQRGVSILVALVLATLVDRAFRSRAARARPRSDGLSPRGRHPPALRAPLIYAAIILIGVAVALSGFSGISNLARACSPRRDRRGDHRLRRPPELANFVAGIMLAITQPIRVGDWVTFEGNYGVVEDVRLNYTILRTLSLQRIVIPNEKLAGGIMKNDTLATDVVNLDVSVWIPPEADAERAIRF